MKKHLLVFLSVLALRVYAGDAPTVFKVSEFTFTQPASWEWVQSSSPMRKAQLKVPDPKGKGAGEVVFFHFGPGDGGGTQANVDRWLSQFKEGRDKINAKTEDKALGGHKVTYVNAAGTYISGMPGGGTTSSMSDYALAGAIIESDKGSVFIKMTGPKELMKSSQSDFRGMVESALK